MERKCGIYKIENLINGKVYIGLSTNILKRWVDHRYRLNTNIHENNHLQRAWIKYGETNFSFEIIEECCESELPKREVYYIGLYESSMCLNGYNKTTGGEKPSITSERTLNQIKASEESMRPIYQVGLNGEIVKEWNSINEVGRNGYNKSLVCACVNKKRKTHSGFIWIDKHEYEMEEFDLQCYIIKDKNNKRIMVVNDNRIFESARDLERQSMDIYGFKLGYKGISKVCNKERRLYKGLKICFLEDFDKEIELIKNVDLQI